MTPFLRRAHRYCWYLLAIALPLGWLAAVWAIPTPVVQRPVRPDVPVALPLVVGAYTAGPYRINLRRAAAGAQEQVEIVLTQPQTSAGTLVYAEGPGHETLLGALNTRGLYRFELDSTAVPLTGLRFIDPIKKRLLRTLAIAPH